MILDTFEEVLANLDSQGEEEFGDDWVEAVRDRLRSLEASYRILTQADRQPIDYSDLATQAAYVFAYGMPRGGFTYERLKLHRAALGRPLFTEQHIRVTSVGGGPASELIGLIHYLSDPEMGEHVASVSYSIVDHGREWEHVANLVADCIQCGIDVQISFQQCNLLNDIEVGKISLAKSHLAIFSYVISELRAFRDKFPVVGNIQSLLHTVDNGSFVLYMDSESYPFYSLFNSCRAGVAGLVQREDIGGNTEFDPGQYQGIFERYCEELERDPRLDGNIVSKLLERE